jgi:CRP-like cAMP-binding protein
MARIPDEVLEHFRKVPLFSGLSKRDLQLIVSAADEFDEPAGTTVVRQGEQRRELFVLTAGSATAIHDGREVGTLGPGDFFGEIALLSGGARTATVRADTDVSLVMLAPDPFRSVLTDEPQVLNAVMHALGERLRSYDPALA